VLDSVIAAEVNSRLWSSQMYIALLGQFSDLVPLCRLSTTTIAVREGNNGSVLLKAPSPCAKWKKYSIAKESVRWNGSHDKKFAESKGNYCWAGVLVLYVHRVVIKRRQSCLLLQFI
jgi:hypothetical protein